MKLGKKSVLFGVCVMCLGVHATSLGCPPASPFKTQDQLTTMDYSLACDIKSYNPQEPDRDYPYTMTTTTTTSGVASGTATGGTSTSTT